MVKPQLEQDNVLQYLRGPGAFFPARVLFVEAAGGALVFPGVCFAAMAIVYIMVCIARNSNA